MLPCSVAVLLSQVLCFANAAGSTSPPTAITISGKLLGSAIMVESAQPSTQVPLILVSKLIAKAGSASTEEAATVSKAAVAASPVTSALPATTLGPAATITTTMPVTSEPVSSAGVSEGPVTDKAEPVVAAEVSEISSLEKKIQSLNCEMPLLPSDSLIWNGNATRTLSFPMKGRSPAKKWRAELTMQSGDILRLEIDSTALTKRGFSGNGGKRHDYPLEVHQMNQMGQLNSCDLSQGVKLEVTAENLNEKHTMTLYDKDFSDGKNYLTVTSKLWGSDCIHLQVVMKSDNCGDDQTCSDKGLCFTKDSMDMFECQCCVGYIGPRCEERDACYPSPCRNNGICVDISQGHDGTTFQCLCPYGFTGKVCEDTSDPCQSGPCQNGGTCSTSNETAAQFKCACPPGFKGPLCQHGSNHCASSPCVNGICVGQRDGYRCFCQPGYTGFQCQLEINECESSPCLNGGTCTDHIGSFSCACGRGYTGSTCRTKVNLCDPNPCSQHHYCIDKGNSYSCECPKGYIGPDCSIPMTKTVCNTNPCRNGGTCWSSIDSYYCACKPEYTGKTCTEKIVMEEIEGDKTAKLLHKKEWVYEMPSGVTHVEHLYVAAGTLACALLIVILTVATCHCRMHETYKSIIRMTPLFGCKSNRNDSDSKTKNGTANNSDKEPLSTRRVMAPVDYTDMYYAMDFSDSQSSPLIQ